MLHEPIGMSHPAGVICQSKAPVGYGSAYIPAGVEWRVTPVSMAPTSALCLSFWFKIIDPAINAGFAGRYIDASNRTVAMYQYNSGNPSIVTYYEGSGSVVWRRSTYLSALQASGWNHFFLWGDTTRSVAEDRLLFYLNGERRTSSSGPYWNNPGASANLRGYWWNASYPMSLFGDRVVIGNCQMAEFHAVHGEQQVRNVSINNFGQWVGSTWVPRCPGLNPADYGDTGGYYPMNDWQRLGYPLVGGPNAAIFTHMTAGSELSSNVNYGHPFDLLRNKFKRTEG